MNVYFSHIVSQCVKFIMQLLEFRFLKFYTTAGVGWRGGALKQSLASLGRVRRSKTPDTYSA